MNYGRRQLFELIQNGADELIGRQGRIEVVLTDHAFYCANEGNPLSARGAGALLGAFNSGKSGVEIGRYGLGFKSIVGVSQRPAIYSRSGSFDFDARRNVELVSAAVGTTCALRPSASLSRSIPRPPRPPTRSWGISWSGRQRSSSLRETWPERTG